MRVIIVKDPRAVAKAVVDIVSQKVACRADLVLGLPTGRTAIPLYDELARRCGRGEVDLSRARGFNLDELILPPNHPQSFRSFMQRYAWVRTGLDPQQCDIPSATADPEEECRRYDRELSAADGLDLALLGVGIDGHVAYNLPGSVCEDTHVVRLPESLAEALEVPERWRPLRAITVGLGTLRSSRGVLLMATGAAKASAVRSLVEGPEDPRQPCSLLRGHDDLDVILDSAAAADL